MFADFANEREIIPLGGLYFLAIRQLYEVECLDDIKEEIESVWGAKVRRINTNYEVRFICRNAVAKTNEELPQYSPETFAKVNKCQFRVMLDKELRMMKPVFRLREYMLEHCPECIDAQQAIYLRLKRELSSLQGIFDKIVLNMKSRKEDYTNVDAIMEIFCRENDKTKNFYLDGVNNPFYSRKLKKKFYNIIANAKKKCIKFYIGNEIKEKGISIEFSQDSVSVALELESGSIVSQPDKKVQSIKDKPEMNSKPNQKVQKKTKDEWVWTGSRRRRTVVTYNEESRKRKKRNEQSEDEQIKKGKRKQIKNAQRRNKLITKLHSSTRRTTGKQDNQNVDNIDSPKIDKKEEEGSEEKQKKQQKLKQLEKITIPTASNINVTHSGEINEGPQPMQ